MDTLPLDQRPGFRRRFRITPETERVCAEVEDDFHCMSVVLYHENGRATRVEPQMQRAPWTTCPGAVAELEQTFTGLPLEQFPSRGGKKNNCTHLYDLAELAAAHAGDSAPVVFDILVSDPVDGRRRAELRRNGRSTLAWVESGMTLVEPPELAGEALWDMKAWIASLEPELREAARLLRWGNMIANGRSIPLAEQSDATRMPPNCYTFQPDRATRARRVGEIKDFSEGPVRPLDDCRPFA